MEKCAVYGAFDGTMAASAVIAAGAAAGLGTSTLMALAWATTFGLAAAAGVRTFLSFTSDLAFYARERKREGWELKNYPQGEVDEMVELLVQWGVDPAPARSSMAALSAFPAFFTDLMMALELRMQFPDFDPTANALATTAGFATAGCLPCGALWLWTAWHPVLPAHWRTTALVSVVVATALASTALLVGVKSRLLPYRSMAWAAGMALLATAACTTIAFACASTLGQ